MKAAFSNKSGISMAIVTRSDNYWELFWSTLVSAVVENEASNEVVLTFGLANTSLTKDDFSIEGFTISSLALDATNKILTLTLTEDFESDTEAEVTFGKTGENYSITNNIIFSWEDSMLESYKSINDHITFTSEEETLILERLNEDYVVTTFGPDGLNKTVCDFFLFFTNSNTSTALTTKTVTKTGDTLRWNYGGGNVYDQNNLPAQINNGVITVTSTDGFSGVTVFTLAVNTFTHATFNLAYYMPAISTFDIHSNAFTEKLPVPPVTITKYWVENNEFEDVMFELSTLVNLQYLQIYNNPDITGSITSTYGSSKIRQIYCFGTQISGVSLASFRKETSALVFYNCEIPTADLDALLAALNVSFTASGVNTNLGLAIGGNLNGFITGGYTNADYLDLVALFAAAGKTLTLTLNENPGAFDKGKVLFTVDDQPLSQHTYALPLFIEKGITGTTYIRTNSIGEIIPGWEEIGCTWEQIEDFLDAGWTVGGHSHDHVGFGGLTEAQMITQIETCHGLFTAAELAVPTHFAYPSGSYDAESLTVLEAYYETTRIVSYLFSEHPHDYVGTSSDKRLLPLPKQIIDLKYYTLADLDYIKKFINVANAQKLAIIFLSHRFTPDQSGTDHTPIPLMRAIIEFIQDSEEVDMDIINMVQLEALIP